MNSIKISWSVKDISIKCYLLSAVSRQPNEFKCLFDTVGLHKPNKNGNFSTGNALFGRKVFVCVSGFHEPADVVDRRILISNSIGEFFNNLLSRRRWQVFRHLFVLFLGTKHWHLTMKRGTVNKWSKLSVSTGNWNNFGSLVIIIKRI